jgi:SAM-dependent methyltransferase
MFTQSEHLYDLIYSQMKDYREESRAVAALVREQHPTAHSVLDVACGTGEHARWLRADAGFDVDGIDLDPAMIAIAARKNPEGAFATHDMRSFDLGRRYDAVLCLFSSIAYVLTIENLTRTLERFRDHIAENGVVIVEPWFGPGVLEHGRISVQTFEATDTKVVRMVHCEVIDRLSRLRFEYLVGNGDGIEHLSEVHDAGIFSVEEMLDCFDRAGLDVTHDPVGIFGRGLYIATRR